MRSTATGAYVLVTAILWLGALPAVLVVDEAAGGFPWRGRLYAGAGLAVAAGGLWLVDAGARQLGDSGIGLFGVVPGDRLVTDGIYARVRNPMDVGTILLAVAPWVALSTSLMWVVPAGALVYYAAGVGPYEDRRLLEAFGDEFREYRRAVPKWRPRRR